MEKSLKRLVNHGGVIQYKHIIETHEDLLRYTKISFEQYADAFRGIIHKKHSDDIEEAYLQKTKQQQAIVITAQINGISVAEATSNLHNKKILGMERTLSKGYTLVVNSSGGYTVWDDKVMSYAEETPENLLQAKNDFSDVEVNDHIVKCDVLILENENRVPKNILKYVKDTLGQNEYSIISNIHFSQKFEEIQDLITLAIKGGCKKIVAESTLQNREQLTDLANLFESVPPMEFHLLLHMDLEKELMYAIGDERAKAIISKHKIVLI